MTDVWDNGPGDKSETLILLALADFCNDDGECWPSVATIAAKARMTERGAQKIIARLVEIGWLEIQEGGGRRNCNLYRIKNPEPRSPRTTFTPNAIAETPNTVPKNPEPRSPEPLRTIKEPSLIKECDEILPTLSQWCSTEAAKSFMAYRRKQKGKALTLTAARRQAEQLKIIFNAGMDTNDALGMAEERGWQSVQADWYFKAKGTRNGEQSHSNSGRGPGGTSGGMVAAFAAVAARRSAGPTRD